MWPSVAPTWIFEMSQLKVGSPIVPETPVAGTWAASLPSLTMRRCTLPSEHPMSMFLAPSSTGVDTVDPPAGSGTPCVLNGPREHSAHCPVALAAKQLLA